MGRRKTFGSFRKCGNLEKRGFRRKLTRTKRTGNWGESRTPRSPHRRVSFEPHSPPGNRHRFVATLRVSVPARPGNGTAPKAGPHFARKSDGVPQTTRNDGKSASSVSKKHRCEKESSICNTSYLSKTVPRTSGKDSIWLSSRKRSLQEQHDSPKFQPVSKRPKPDSNPYDKNHHLGQHRPQISQTSTSNQINTRQTPGQKTQHQNEGPKPMSYSCVKEICEQDSPEESAAKLCHEHMFRRFEALLATGKEMRYDLMKMVVRLIEVASRSTTESHANKLLGIMIKTNFWDTLSKFVGELYSTKEATKDTCLSTLIMNLCKIFSLCLDRLPDLQSSIPISQLRDAVESFKGEEKLQEAVIESSLKELIDKRQRLMKEKRERATSVLQPPNDFRTLSVFPCREDIFGKERPFLRENLVGRPFSNVDHYLDVQFRLLKEDSLADLRNGIRDLKWQDRQNELQVKLRKGQKNDARKLDVKVYKGVKINDVVATTRNRANGIVYNVSFNAKDPAIKHTNWARSKRLLFGSLVCLTDEFQTLRFATVQNRSPDELSQGCLQLCFEGEEISSLEYHDTQQSYRMVESCSAYFMAYRHILKQLQEIREETMPFKNYIIACKREIKQPAYLKPRTGDTKPKTIDLTWIAAEDPDMDVEDQEKARDALKNIDPCDFSTWPSADAIGLNDSQYGAFQSALTREFAVIQGPPGTGKTYLGLKIAHALLANSHLWEDEENKSCPVLMLAYTNHALDQFLEGLSIDKQDIIRAGARSSSEALKECNLNAVRQMRSSTAKSPNGMPRQSQRRLRQVERRLSKCNSKLRGLFSVYSQSVTGILPARELTEHMHPVHFEELLCDEGMLKFLYTDLNPDAKKDDVMNVENEDNETEFGNEDNRGHFSAAQFIRHGDDESEPERQKIVICFANETRNPKEVESELTQSLVLEEALRLENRANSAERLWQLNRRERWCLYRLWLAKLWETLDTKIKQEQAQHLELSGECEELRNMKDLSLLRSARVVGMTTTWAAKNHKLLRQLRPRIVMIEEAAEVFEAHVVSCLTEHCQHLILIGDHQQLRPNPSVYKLGVKYSLDVSLLERMIAAGIPYDRLAVQHRMRPEISQIMRHIYSDLKDHESVKEYENVEGISKNLYFVNHCFPEGVHDNAHSKTNKHEATFLVALCHYLLRQGYHPSQITILTTYTGQMFVIRDLMKSKDWNSFPGARAPRVVTVDNFQGEENDIILLSLVRNNEEDKIGFLKTSNRVCVALSRARKGLYIIGNRDILAKQSDLWKSVLDDLDKNGCVGETLTLTCRNHGTEITVASAEDFDERVPNGGCLEPCKHRLKCGHACPQTCHPDGHEAFRCKKPCEKSPCSIQGHKCTRLCHEPCDIFCNTPVEKVLKCGHSQTLACSTDVERAKCTERCDKKLPCGHRCQSYCSQPCTKECMELVKKTDWPCGHDNTIACSATPKDCAVPCNTLLPCGHPCPGKCGSCLQGRVHEKCNKKCKRILICSHPCNAQCTKECPPCKKDCMRKCDHSKCKHPCGNMCIPCKERCDWECEHFKCTNMCSEMCDRPRCDAPCNRKLFCGKKGQPHYCRGLCGERCVCVFCHTNNGEDIRTTFFGTEDEEDARFIRLKDCEHIFEYTALDQYMDQEDDSGEIRAKVCPRCQQPIEKTWRYGNIVRKIHEDIDCVKRKVLGNTTDFAVKKVWVMSLVNKVSVTLGADKHLNKFKAWNKLQEMAKQCSIAQYREIVLLESQLRLLKYWLVMMNKYEDALNMCEDWRKFDGHGEFRHETDDVLRKIVVNPSTVDTRVLEDLRLELERLSLKRDVLVLQTKLAAIELSLQQTDEAILAETKKRLKDKAKIEDANIEKFQRQITEIYSRYPQLAPVTPEERVQIVKAIGLKQGHWFKCPNGHCYAIGECGGAMEKSKCPECGTVIGGQQHRLEDSNELAPEMDGAQHAAWSEQANLANYRI